MCGNLCAPGRDRLQEYTSQNVRAQARRPRSRILRDLAVTGITCEALDGSTWRVTLWDVRVRESRVAVL